jgi:glycosyltransferase involved in cell wall biosynthesis
MNIGILTSHLAVGDNTDSGIGQHYRILADALCAEGHAVHVFYCCADPVRAKRDIEKLEPRWTFDIVGVHLPAWLLGVTKRSWPLQICLINLFTSWRAARAVTAASCFRKIEIIETHSYGALALFLLQRRVRCTIVTRVSTTSRQTAELSPLRSRVLALHACFESYVIRQSDALVTHTIQHRNAICRLEHLEPSRFSIVTHGLPDPCNATNARKHQLGKINFLFVGRFEYRKGIDVLLAAIPQVASQFPGARFTLAGSPGDGVEWNAFAERHPELAGRRVISLERVSAATLHELYSECDILVAPSRYESFGLIYAEAMAYGKPVIGCNVGGIPEVVLQGVTGLLAQPGDVFTLIESMCRLASDAELRERMGRAARADFVARFSAQTLARSSTDLYQLCLNRLGSLNRVR